MIFQGIWTSIAKKPYIFVIFQGGGPTPLSPPLDPPMKVAVQGKLARVQEGSLCLQPLDKTSKFCHFLQSLHIGVGGVQWLSGRVLDSESRSCGSEPDGGTALCP